MTALAGMRVVDLTDDSGRFATKLLTMFGADVVRVTTVGSPGRPLPDHGGAGVLDHWYDGGKRSLPLDLDSGRGQTAYRRLVANADVVVETEAPGRLAALGLDHVDLIGESPGLVQVSITPFGRSGPRAEWLGSDLVHAAMGGFMSVTGLPDAPLNVWGRQTYNYAGFAGALAALAGLRAARVDGHGRHFDVSVHEAVTGSIENLFFQLFFDDELPDLPRIAERQGALHWLRAYDTAPTRDGQIMITPTPDPATLFRFMFDLGHEAAGEWVDRDVESMLESIDDVMDCIRDFVAGRDAMELWWQAQAQHCALGAVHDVEAVAAIAQFEHRGLFTSADGGPTMPGHYVKLEGTPTVGPCLPADQATDLDTLVAEWQGGGGASAPTGAPGVDRLARPLEGVRVADFTWVLAGPHCTRMLGDLGADVIRIQNEERSTLVNRPDYPYFFVWNRAKRSATLNMKHPDARAAARRLIENCDVLIENYSAGVLDAWGLDWQTVHEWNPRLVYVTMSGCGHDGPWKHVISYAPTVHAVCGLTHLTNFVPGEAVGPGFSLNDHLAGWGAAVATMAALAARDRTGVGQRVDMAQLEVGTFSIGPALIEWFATGEAPEPAGNRDGLADHVPNNVFATTDGFVAISVTDDVQWPGLVAVVGSGALADPALAAEPARRARRAEIDAAIKLWSGARTSREAVDVLQAAGVSAGWVQDAADLFADAHHEDRGFWQEVEHAGFGPRHVDTFPALVDGRRIAVERAAPAYLGEHNFEVWTEVAGYEFDEVAEGMGHDLFT